MLSRLKGSVDFGCLAKFQNEESFMVIKVEPLLTLGYFTK